MPSLRDAQAAMATALREGPSRLPRGLFSTSRRRTLLALAAHANTVSHGRLVALEDTFPQARTALGAVEFNRLSRTYLDRGHGRDGPIARLGEGFPEYLAAHAPDQAVRAARFDLAFLAAYQAAEARALPARVLGAASGDDVLELVVRRHPAARLVAGDPALNRRLGLPTGEHILVTRPKAEMRARAIAPVAAQIFALLARAMKLGNLFAFAAESIDEMLIPAGVMALIEAGALAGED